MCMRRMSPSFDQYSLREIGQSRVCLGGSIDHSTYKRRPCCNKRLSHRKCTVRHRSPGIHPGCSSCCWLILIGTSTVLRVQSRVTAIVDRSLCKRGRTWRFNEGKFAHRNKSRAFKLPRIGPMLCKQMSRLAGCCLHAWGRWGLKMDWCP